MEFPDIPKQNQFCQYVLELLYSGKVKEYMCAL